LKHQYTIEHKAQFNWNYLALFTNVFVYTLATKLSKCAKQATYS